MMCLHDSGVHHGATLVNARVQSLQEYWMSVLLR